ncbi:MAG: S8 family serine peptidase [Pyrinomonadaceae bacterium]|nr:S8 family serine peptidase [Phycisphaerales bacterium]
MSSFAAGPSCVSLDESLAPSQAMHVATDKVHSAVRQRFAIASDDQPVSGFTQAPPRIKVWVFLTDKGSMSAAQTTAAIARTAEMYNPRALHRRQLRRTDPGLVDQRDLPIAESYLAHIARTGASIHITSTWLNAASVYVTAQQVRELASLDCVSRIELVRGGVRRELPVSETLLPVMGTDLGRPRAPLGPPPIEGQCYELQSQIGVIAMHNMGFTGEGVIIGILDTGFKRTHAAFNTPGHVLNVVAERDFIFNDGNTANEPADDPDQHNHGTYCLGLIAAYSAGAYAGAAYDASVILCKTEDVRSETPIEEDNYVAGLQFIESNGGDLATASLGYIDWYTQADLNGTTAVTSIAVNIATANGLICCNAAGNEGHDTDPATSHLVAPADAFKVLTVGAVDWSGAIAGFSSDGPSFDGRVKPEILARGVDNPIVRVGNDTDYTTGSGTSFAAPLVAGAVACLLEAHPDWTVDQMRAYLFTSAGYFAANHTFEPTLVEGYGIINAAIASRQDCNNNGVNDAVEIAAGALEDCNVNGVPDICDINLGPAAHFSADTNHDGRPDECPGCPADWNHSGAVNSQDFFDFIAAFFAEDADFNMNGKTTSQDFFDFLAAFFGGC